MNKKLAILGLAIGVTVLFLLGVYYISGVVIQYFFSLPSEEKVWWRGAPTLLMLGLWWFFYSRLWRNTGRNKQ